MDIVTNPWEWWVGPFVDHEFMRTALASGLLVVVCTSVVGTWVVLRGMTFLGEALAHGVLPGIAVAVVAGYSVSLGALVAALVMVGGIGIVRRRSPLPEDTAIGILFVGMLALAIVILSSQSDDYIGDLNAFLFGSITAVGDGELVRLSLAAAVTVIGAAVLHRAFLVATFDEVQARLLGLRPQLASAVLLVLLAIAVVASFEAVGSLLVFAFLVAPPAAAALVVRRVPVVMITAAAIGAVSVVVGLLVSFHEDTAPGASMALVAVAGFVIALLVRSLRGGHQLVTH